MRAQAVTDRSRSLITHSLSPPLVDARMLIVEPLYPPSNRSSSIGPGQVCYSAKSEAMSLRVTRQLGLPPGVSSRPLAGSGTWTTHIEQYLPLRAGPAPSRATAWPPAPAPAGGGSRRASQWHGAYFRAASVDPRPRSQRTSEARGQAPVTAPSGPGGPTRPSPECALALRTHLEVIAKGPHGALRLAVAAG